MCAALPTHTLSLSFVIPSFLLLHPLCFSLMAGDYTRAVDAYLKLTADQTSDYDFLEEMWEKVCSSLLSLPFSLILYSGPDTRLWSLPRSSHHHVRELSSPPSARGSVPSAATNRSVSPRLA